MAANGELTEVMTCVLWQSTGRNEIAAGADDFHLGSYLKSDTFDGGNGMTGGSWVLTKQCGDADFP